MTVMSPPTRTADPWGIGDYFPKMFRKSAPSTVNVAMLASEILDVLNAWDDAYVSEEPAPAVSERPYPATPVAAVEYLRNLLQIPREQALSAVGVAERSFYQWKNGSVSQPRAASLGRLWPMVQALAPLAAAHPNLAAWFHSTPAAEEAFAAGQVNRLVQIEFEWAMANNPELARGVPHFGDPGDAVPDVAEDGPSAPAMPAARAPRVRRTPRVRNQRDR